MKKVIMYKPKPDTVRNVYGVDVFNKKEFEVPENKVRLLKEFGYKVKDVESKKKGNSLKTKKKDK